MVDVLFTFLNFGVLAGLLYYGWNRFAVPALENVAHKESVGIQLLHAEHRTLLKESRVLDESIRAQEEECKSLSAKVLHWRSVVEAVHIQRADDQARMQKIYKQKIEEQAKKHRSALLYQKIKPLVLAQVEEDLRVHFKGSDAKRLYTDQLLRELQR